MLRFLGKAFLGLFAFSFCLSLLSAMKAPINQASAPAAPAVAPVAPSRSSGHIGDDVVLELPGGSVVFLAVDDQAWDEMIQAQTIEDTVGLLELIRTGKVFRVPNGTRGKVLKGGFASRLVRIQEGEMAGSKGWTQMEFVKGL